MSTEPYYPLAIVGAGASGLMAAAAASRMGPRPCILLEKGPRAGRKLLATGNGRCNIINLRPDMARVHGDPAALPILRRHPPQAILERFARMGLVCREEDEGRAYPLCGHAGAVLDVLRAAAVRQGAELRLGAEVVSVSRADGGFALRLSGGEIIRARRVIIACGGCAAPVFGADGGAHRLLGTLGHTVTAVRPALAPLKLEADRVRGLKGVRVRAGLSLSVGGRPVQSEDGEVLFTEYGVSGVAAMQMARRAGDALSRGERVMLTLSLLSPEEAAAQTALRLSMFDGAPWEGFFTGLLHSRVAMLVLREAGLSPADTVTARDAARVEALLSALALPVQGVLPFEHAQITAGGVPVRQFDPDTLESRRVPGLYACGEALDVDGDCGGYNLWWAWASGGTAGTAVHRGDTSPL